jgi:hypothetical protein
MGQLFKPVILMGCIGILYSQASFPSPKKQEIIQLPIIESSVSGERIPIPSMMLNFKAETYLREVVIFIEASGAIERENALLRANKTLASMTPEEKLEMQTFLRTALKKNKA